MPRPLRDGPVTPVRVAIFARYPEPGRTKTRLIPALGAERAAALHRYLTERAIEAVRASGLPWELRATGGEANAFRAWLGDDVAVFDQGDGDIGARMARAAAATPVLVVGTDIPDLSTAHLMKAAASLTTSEAVIGPAEDGGYWLLGLARPMPFLFVDMPWSTDAVLRLTLERLAARGIVPAMLDTLSDLDRPEDLDRWPALRE